MKKPSQWLVQGPPRPPSSWKALHVRPSPHVTKCGPTRTSAPSPAGLLPGVGAAQQSQRVDPASLLSSLSSPADQSPGLTSQKYLLGTPFREAVQLGEPAAGAGRGELLGGLASRSWTVRQLPVSGLRLGPLQGSPCPQPHQPLLQVRGARPALRAPSPGLPAHAAAPVCRLPSLPRVRGMGPAAWPPPSQPPGDGESPGVH